MNFKKRVNGSWADIPHYVHKTATDTITTLPAVIYPNDTTATVGLKGQTVQNGTPTPDNPIMPQGCGNKTANLLDNSLTDTEDSGIRITVNPDKSITLNGSLISGTQKAFNIGTITAENGKDYTISGITGFTTSTLQMLTDSSTAFPSGNRLLCFNGAITRTAYGGETCAVKLYAYSGVTYNNVRIYPMVTQSSTAIPYEPYGYKIPISSANTTNPVYLGEVQNTRKIKKLVLDGTENWTYEEAYSRFWINVADFITSGLCLTPFISNAFGSVSDGRPIADVPNNTIYSGSWGGVDTHKIFIKTTEYTSAADFKSYLSAQYTAGTPVTVWYVLATPETGIVNEPLMRIGDYADEVTGITIPVTAGGDTLSVGTTVQPSEVSLSYTGWHPAIVHERTNGAWD